MVGISKNMQRFVLWVMLAAIAVSYTGKALHTHDSSYYDSLRTTQNAASNGMSDDCPICHFNLVFFALGEHHAFAFYILLLTVICALQPILRTIDTVQFFSLRAPPVVL